MTIQGVFRWLQHNRLMLGLLIVLSAIHSSKHAIGLLAHSFPPALDPYYFAAQSAAWIEGKTTLRTLAFAVPDYPFGYQPLLVILLGGISLLLPSTQMITLYEWAGVVMGAALIPLFFLALRRPFGTWPALAGAAAYAFSPYVFYRTYLTLPENLGFLFLLCFLWAYFRERVSWQVCAVGCLSLIALFYTHATFVFALAIAIPFLLVLLLPKLSVRRLPLALVVGIGLVGLVIALRRYVPTSILNPSYLGWTNLALSTIHRSFFLPLIGVAGIGFLVAFVQLVRREQLAAKVVLAVAVLVPGAFLYLGEPTSFGNLTTDRFYPFAALGFAVALSYALHCLDRVQPVVVRLACALLLIVMPLLPTVDNWHWVFTDQEYAAAQQLQTVLPEDAIVVEQPILDWLTRGVAHRTVPWEAGALIGLPREELIERAESLRNGRPVYVLVSTTKIGTVYEIDTTAGTTRRVGYPAPYMVQTDLRDFTDLPLVYRHGTVLVYQLLP